MHTANTHRQQVTALADALERVYSLAESLQRAAHEAANAEGFELTNDLWESAHRLLWARIEAARSFQLERRAAQLSSVAGEGK